MVYNSQERITHREHPAGGQEYLIQTCEGIKPYFDYCYFPLFSNQIQAVSILFRSITCFCRNLLTYLQFVLFVGHTRYLNLSSLLNSVNLLLLLAILWNNCRPTTHIVRHAVTLVVNWSDSRAPWYWYRRTIGTEPMCPRNRRTFVPLCLYTQMVGGHTQPG